MKVTTVTRGSERAVAKYCEISRSVGVVRGKQFRVFRPVGRKVY